MDRLTAVELVGQLTGRPQWPKGVSSIDIAKMEISLAAGERRKSLDLRGLGLRSLPEEIAKLTGLTSLNLGNNEFEAIPEVVFHLTSVRHLFLQENKLSQIPPQIDRLSCLEVIYAHNNQISHLSERVGSLSALKVLDISHNEISSIPESLGDLQRLEQLYMGSNGVRVLPESLTSLTSLRRLDLSSNAIEALPDALGMLLNLEMLDIEHNRVRRIPISVQRLQKLAHFWLDGNPLERELDFLSGPEGFNGIAQSQKAARRAKSIADRVHEFGTPMVPPPGPGPKFRLTHGPTIEVLEEEGDADLNVENLLPLLREALADLAEVTIGSNQFQLVHRRAISYAEQFEGGSRIPSIDACFTHGLRLANACGQTRKEMVEEGLSGFPAAIAEASDSALSLHGIVIASSERGRQLIELSNRYRGNLDRAAMNVALLGLKDAVSQRPDLFASSTREATESAISDATSGEASDASTSEAMRTVFNLTTTIGKVAILAGTAVATEAIGASKAGHEAIAGLAAYIDELLGFVVKNGELFSRLAAAGGADFHWLITLVDWIKQRLRILRG